MLGNAPVHTWIPAVDLDRAKKFYTEVLGLEVEDDTSMPGLVLLKAGENTRIMLYVRGATKADHTVCAFIVDYIDKYVDGLVERGVKFEHYNMDMLQTDEKGVARMDTATAAWFKDTEGNILSLNGKV